MTGDNIDQCFGWLSIYGTARDTACRGFALAARPCAFSDRRGAGAGNSRRGIAASVIGNGELFGGFRHEDGVFKRQPRRARTVRCLAQKVPVVN
jgi:hypothetical protein